MVDTKKLFMKKRKKSKKKLVDFGKHCKINRYHLFDRHFAMTKKKQNKAASNKDTFKLKENL